MAIARVSFRNRLLKLGLLQKGVLLVSSVHDSIVVDTPMEYIEIVTKLMYEVFDDLQKNILKLFNYQWVTPLACEVKMGPNMKNMEKVPRPA